MMETTGFQSNLVNIENVNLALSINKSNEDKIRQILEHISKKQPSEIERDIIFRVLDLCECHEYKESRIMKYGKFELLPRKVIKSTHPKKLLSS